MTTPRPSLLTIAGADPSSGAGIGADMAVMRDWGYHATSVITAVIAQDTTGVRAFWPTTREQVDAQLTCILGDIPPAGVKLGVLASPATVEVVAHHLAAQGRSLPVILDPVLASGQNDATLGGRAVAAALTRWLLPHVTLLTPNAPEASVLTGLPVRDRDEQLQASLRLVEMGASAVLLKGGHLDGAPGDLLVHSVQGGRPRQRWFPVEQTYPYAVRGTGCHLATALCAALASGLDMEPAVARARAYLDRHWRDRAEALGRGARVFVHAAERRPWEPS
ncbi:MAG: bifunctional hydroxymethylpyrimidine kinase/phosphomethylpyrimidine kinase [Myxococcales bacterium]|nr:bifunctional hydroxymethylpyrimidine kinase/phosphomethylpyrimidine kinase [Myxococcales bacterium]